MTSIHLEIVGMSCEHCIRAVRGRLERTPGVTVQDVKVGSADLRLDPAKTTIADIEDAVSDEGYTVDSFSERPA